MDTGKTPETQDSTTTGRRVIDRVAARFKRTGRERNAPPSSDYPKKKSALVKFIKGALFGLAIQPLVLTVAYNLSAPLDNAQAEHARGLTQGEVALAKALFGSDFKTDTVMIRTHDSHPANLLDFYFGRSTSHLAAYVRGSAPNDIHMVDENTHAIDYARTKNTSRNTHTFIHEVAHVWQFRQDKPPTHCKVYEYTLTPQSRFEDFCIEQQAEILADYATRYLVPDKLGLVLATHNYLNDMARTGQSSIRSGGIHPDLVRVVEEHFPHARTARLSLEDTNVRTLSCTFNAIDQRQITATMSSRVYQDAFNACAERHLRTLDGQTLTVDAGRSPLDTASTSVTTPVRGAVTTQRGRSPGNRPG